MAMTWIWTGMVVLSLAFGLFTGRLDAVADAALSGASAAVELSLSMAGVLCLWSGVMEVMNVCGLSAGLARLFRPALRRLMPEACQDQETLAALPRSGSRRTDAELCLLRLSDETLDDSAAGLSARIARLEEQLAAGVPAPASAPASQAAPARPAPEQPKQPAPAPRPAEDRPPWDEEEPPLPPEPEEEPSLPEPPFPARPVPREEKPAPERRAPSAAPSQSGGGDRSFWTGFVQGLRGKVPPTIMPYLHNPAKVQGVWKNGKLTLWVDGEFTRSMLNKPAILEPMAQAAAAAFGAERPAVSVVVGQPPADDLPPAGEPAPASAPPAQEKQEKPDALDELLAFGEQFDNIIIQ